jgi:muramoyltetrapeptide carboxypeptidase
MAEMPVIPRTKPRSLRSGDTVGIIAPASNIKREMLDAGCEALRQLGYKPFYFDSIFERDLYFAGSVERRVGELEEMFVREDIRAIICARGGYGTNYLLGKVDLGKLKVHPKIFIGYSDVTSLLTWFVDLAGLVTFHGPMATKDFAHLDGIDLASWQAALGGMESWALGAQAASTAKPLIEGSAEGTLYGGCLSMLAASLGTPYEIHTEDTILFVEDVATKPFQIDRMLMQLKLAGKLDGVRGMVFGEMLDCFQTRDQDYSLQEVILRVVGDLGIPVADGLRSGHVSRQNVTLPLGVRVRLRVTSTGVELRFLEAATTAEPAARSSGA